MTDQYDFWRRALSGEKVGGDTLPIHEDQPESGFYRKRTGKSAGYSPVAIWRGDDGVLVGLLSGNETNPVDLWTYCCRHPITEQQYRDFMATGRWHDEDASVAESLAPPPAGHNNPPAVETLQDQIQAALKGVDAYTEVKDDETAAKAQSLRSRLLELSRNADKEREAKKRPHFEAGKAVDELYQPLVKAAKGGADTIAKALSAHETAKYKAEQARIAAERAKEAEETAKHAPIGVEPEPAPAPAPAPPVKIAGAYGRAAGVKLVKIAVVADQDAAYGYLKAQPELVDLIQKLAQKAVNAGLTVPGVTVDEQRKVS